MPSLAAALAEQVTIYRYGRDDVDELGSGSGPDLDRPVPDASCAHELDRGPRRRWAQPLARVYEVHPLRCPSGYRPGAWVAVRCASSRSSPTPPSCGPSSETSVSPSIRRPSRPREARRKPSYSPSIRLRHGTPRTMRPRGPTPSIRAYPETTGPGAPETPPHPGSAAACAPAALPRIISTLLRIRPYRVLAPPSGYPRSPPRTSLALCRIASPRRASSAPHPRLDFLCVAPRRVPQPSAGPRAHPEVSLRQPGRRKRTRAGGQGRGRGAVRSPCGALSAPGRTRSP